MNIAKYLKNPYALFDRITDGEKFKWMDDATYLRLKFRGRLGYRLNLERPETYNEKIQWLKINNRKPIYNTMVDKYAAKEYVAKLIGEQYIIPTLGVWNSFDEIDFDQLPNQFVLKTTHDSGGYVICKDKSKLDLVRSKEKLEKCLNKNFYYYGREWAYKDVKPRIIAETYLENGADNGAEQGALTDYKFFCTYGTVHNVMVCTGRTSNKLKYYFFDKEWNFLRYNHGDDELPLDFTIDRPACLSEMINIAEILSKNTPFMRVDLYFAENKVWFGEITLYPDSGFDVDITYDTDVLFGKLIDLPKSSE